MSQWHYVDKNRQQQGPVEDAELVRLFRSGDVSAETLVWRPDLTDWQALGGFAEQLGLRDAASPYAPPTSEVLRDEQAVVGGGEVVYAGFWKRVAAYIIDSFVAGFVGAIIGGIVGGLLGATLLSSGGMSGNAGAFMGIQLIGNLIGMLLGVAYYAGMHSSSSMATLGKMAVGIKVVRSDGSRISFLRGVGRYFGLIVSSITLGIGFFMAGFTERKRALHDMLCDTLVVDKWAFTAHPELQRRDLGGVTIAILAVGGLFFVLAIVAIVAAIYMAASNWH